MGNVPDSGKKKPSLPININDPSLTRLDLRNKNLQTVPIQITTLQNLTWLNLPNNQIENIPEHLFLLTSLVTLRLQGNKITQVSEMFGKFVNLTCLDISKNQIVVVGDALGDLVSLVDVNFHWNRIKEVSPCVNSLTQLKTLNISLNRLKNLPEINDLKCLENLDLSHNRLTSLPESLKDLKRLVNINLAGNSLELLDDLVLEGLNSLRSFDLQCNELKSLPEEIGCLGNTLKYFRLKSNQLKTLPQSISSLVNLEELEVSHNMLTDLPKEGFGNLTKVHTVLLFHNAITNLPNDICKMSCLKELDVAFNNLETIPKSLSECKNLITLSIHNNLIKELHPDLIKGFTSLQELICSHNCLSSFPDTLDSMITLRRLDCSSNKLKTFPETKTLTNLVWLELAINRLREFPKSFAKYQSLTTLNLCGNMIKEIPQYIGQLFEMRKLFLSYNKISDLPQEIEKLTSIQELYLGGNQFETVPPCVFKLTSLTELCLSNNSIQEISQSISELTNLKVLRLNCNKITQLAKTIGNIYELTELDLSHNEFTELPMEFGELVNMVDLDVSGNNLTCLPSSFEMNCLNLKQLKISFNKFRRLPHFGNIIGSEYSEKTEQITPLSNDQSAETRSSSDSYRLSKPWISCTANEFLQDWYTTKDESKFLAKLEKQERKLLKMQLKEKKKRSPDDDDDPDITIYDKGYQSGDDDKVKGNNEIIAKNKSLNKNLDSGEITDFQRAHSSPNSPETSPNQVRHQRGETNFDSPTNLKRRKKNFKKSMILDGPIELDYKTKLGWSEMRGRRPEMQDTISLFPNFRGNPAKTLLCSFDGHSGEKSAELCARRILSTVTERLEEMENNDINSKKVRADKNSYVIPERDYVEAVTRAFHDLHSEITEKKYDDGTAALVIIVEHDNERIIVANAGDQRVVLVRGPSAIQITNDHKPDEPNEKVRIYHKGGFVNEQKRVDGILALSRALGDNDLQPHVTYEPEVFVIDPIKPNDKFLIIACDGLWDVISNEQAQKIVESQKTPAKAAAALRDYAHNLGSGDNISVIVYRLDQNKKSKKMAQSEESSSSGKERIEKGKKFFSLISNKFQVGSTKGKKKRPHSTNTQPQKPEKLEKPDEERNTRQKDKKLSIRSQSPSPIKLTEEKDKEKESTSN